MTPKHVPQRTCVACRQVKSKRDLIRVVRVLDGRVIVDETGKANGRGAYLCRDRACWEKAVGQPRRASSSPLAHSLKVALSEADRAALLDYAQLLGVVQQLPNAAPVDSNNLSC